MQARSRTIVEQERHGGKPCEGDPQEMQGCNMQACPSKKISNDLKKCFIENNTLKIFTYYLTNRIIFLCSLQG